MAMFVDTPSDINAVQSLLSSKVSVIASPSNRITNLQLLREQQPELIQNGTPFHHPLQDRSPYEPLVMYRIIIIN
jgi:hypothetical protein